MKKTFLTLSLFLTATIAFAQDKGFVTVNFGSSIPLGDFAGTDINNNSSGFAQTGYLFDATLGLKFSKYFGTTILIRSQVNQFDEETFAEHATKEIGYKATVNSTAWYIGNYMIGTYGSFPISKNFTLEPRMMVGFLTATSPEMTLKATAGSIPFWVTKNSSSSGSLSYLFGIGYKVNAGKHICISFNLDYLGTSTQFNNVETTDSFGGIDFTSWNQNIETFSLSAGIGFRFGTKKKLTINDI